MLIKNLNSFSNHGLLWVLIAVLTMGGALLNAWLGFPFPASFEGIHSAIGGVIPYSDSEAYLSGAHQFIESGFLGAWNMRRPLNTLLLAFYLKVTHLNFWYALAIQAGICAVALALYLKALRQDIGTFATFVSLIFLFYYAQSYIQTTLSETLGLTLGLFSFVLLWNGWIQRNRFIFNAGIATLAIGLSARAGPNFMAFAPLFLVCIAPFTSSRFKDLLGSLLSFAIPFFLMTKLSHFFGHPSAGGMAFSNFGLTLYGLVQGGYGWTYADHDPFIQNLLPGKSEAQQAVILYQESWNAFKSNPLNLIYGMGKYVGAFFVWFVRRLTFGEGVIKTVTTIISIIFWIFIGIRIYLKRHFPNRAFLFLIIIFASITVSSAVIFKDGGMRTFAVAIPYMGAIIGFAFAFAPSFIYRKTPENWIAIYSVAFMVLAGVTSRYVPCQIPDASTLGIDKVPGQETFLTYRVNKQPYVKIARTEKFHFRTISPIQIKNTANIYEDGQFRKDLINIANQYNDDHFVLLDIYDYISHENKIIISEKNILNSESEWILITCNIDDKGLKEIYKMNNYTELP